MFNQKYHFKITEPIKFPPWLSLAIKLITCTLALQKTSLTELTWGYKVDLPLIKYIFAIFQNTSGWGMNAVFIMGGLSCLLYLTKSHPLQKSKSLTAFSLFLAICTVFGRSYYDLGNWNYIFHGKLQFGLACFVMAGYYWLFKNLLILIKIAADKFHFMERKPEKKIAQWLFLKHPFGGPFCVIAACNLPIMISFFPGTLQWDALEQICTYLGQFEPWTTHHPVPVTWLLGQCLYLSRVLFHCDSLALFFYAGSQYVIQWLVFSYGVYLVGKLKVSSILQWGTLLYFALFPLWQIWGFTVVKDSLYYIFLLLLLLVFLHIMVSRKTGRWQWFLLALCSMAVTYTRNNGIHVLILFCMAILLLYRKYWKVGMLIACSALLANYALNTFYIEPKGILPGQVGEMLSVPLQQTARYVKEHYDEITETEMSVLSHLFTVEVEQLGELYHPELSDPVKAEFMANPTGEELKQYFEVWFAQLKKHPDTYVQAYLNHIYGYFYPDREEFWEGIGRYYIGNSQHWTQNSLDIKFYMEYQGLRDLFEQEAHYVKRIPLVGMLYSCGLHNDILLGCLFYLLAHRKYRETVFLVPSLLTVLVCLVSPVDAYIRYMLPVMAAMPMNIAWSLFAVKIPGLPSGTVQQN